MEWKIAISHAKRKAEPQINQSGSSRWPKKQINESDPEVCSVHNLFSPPQEVAPAPTQSSPNLVLTLPIMQVKVKTLTGRDIPVDIEPTDKVIRIKEMMEEKEGIPPAQQRLIFSGSQLNDEITVQESGILPGASLHLVLTLRGGN